MLDGTGFESPAKSTPLGVTGCFDGIAMGEHFTTA
jgi:hypothetical protein